MEKCCQGKIEGCVCDFCDLCEEKVEGFAYGFDIQMRDGEVVEIQGCHSCISQMFKDMTGSEFPTDEEFTEEESE